ncbi:predicted protein [Naegleria gruberi]|uniref:Predicted protein n=1 Tax=Naegleria gruberi TaxID=5762 RepID=D2V338_NAEGR|nr:uncharacterized protein NAEGRDRAFT_63216 [Naegleria gruberi]EFC48709.1 predicted protein [Naegleria gruberi]|eukprot:XP_002681453.1 predicted protein [Naegleria gruberi strain NEG-M]
MTQAEERKAFSQDNNKSTPEKNCSNNTDCSTGTSASPKRRILIHGIPGLFSDFLLFDPRVSKSSSLNGGTPQEEKHYFKPALGVVENSKEFKVICNVPGLERENLKINIDEEVRVLIISGKVEQENSGDKILVRERNSGSFKRSIYLPKQANLEQVKAQLENGVLRIIINKSEETKKIRTIRLSNL